MDIGIHLPGGHGACCHLALGPEKTGCPPEEEAAGWQGREGLRKGPLGSPGHSEAPGSPAAPESEGPSIRRPLCEALVCVITAGSCTQGGKLALDPVETTVSLLGSERDCTKHIKPPGSCADGDKGEGGALRPSSRDTVRRALETWP